MNRLVCVLFYFVLLATGCDSQSPITPEDRANDVLADEPGLASLRPLSPDSIAIRFVAHDVDRLAGFEILLQRGEDFSGRMSIDTLMSSNVDTTAWYFFPRRNMNLFLQYFWENTRGGAPCPCSFNLFDLEKPEASWYTLRIANIFRAGITNRWRGSLAENQVIDSLGGDMTRLRFHNGNSFAIDSLRVFRPRQPYFQQRVEPGASTPYLDMPGLSRWPFFSYRVGPLLVELATLDDTPDLPAWPPGWYTIPIDTLHWHGGRRGGFPAALWIQE